LKFVSELASYYLAPIGEVLRLALPALERERLRDLEAQGELVTHDGGREVGGRRVAFARPTDAIEPAGSLRGQAAAILARLRANGEEPVARLEERFGNARAAVKKLAEKKLVVIDLRDPPRDPFFASPLARDLAP